MPRYAITEKAGRFVAGQTNNGAGTVIELTEKQAEHEVRLGTLIAVGAEKPAEAAPEGAEEAASDPAAATPATDAKAATAPAPKAAKATK